MNKKVITVIIAIVLLLGIGYGVYHFTRNSSDKGNETKQTNDNVPNMDEATKEDKEKFTISDVVIEYENGYTITTGKVKNNDNQARKISIQVKFYHTNNRVASTANVIIESINKGEEKTFSMSTMGDYSSNDYTYKVEVEYIK